MTDFHIQIRKGNFDVAQALRYAALAGIRFAGLCVPSDGDLASVIDASALCRKLSLYANVEAVVGVEFCHLPPALIPEAVKDARRAGISFIAVYGETLTDQVEQGTNFAAIDAGADLLTHPGLLDEKCAAFAHEKGMAVEFTSAAGHCLCNAHVASMALRHQVPLVRGSNASSAETMTVRSFWPSVIQGADVFGGEPLSRLALHLKKSEEFLARKLIRF